METKNISLTVGERNTLVSVFPSLKGDMVLTSVLLEDIKPLNVTEEEWAEAKRERITIEGGERWSWTEEGSEKEIPLHVKTIEALKKYVKEKSDAGELSISDLHLINIDKKLS